MQHIVFMAPLIGASVLLLVVHIAAQSVSALVQHGIGWNAGPRDDAAQQQRTPFEGRAERALRNYLESFAAFGILSLTLAWLQRADGLALTAAWVWIAARIVYLPLYLAGVPYLRSFAWLVSALVLLVMTLRVF